MAGVTGGDASVGGGADAGSSTTPGCAHDADCGSGHYCGSAGTCETGCSTTAECGSGHSCCDHGCLATDGDPANCGACGSACGSGDACCSSSCRALDTLADCGACGSACGSGDSCDQVGSGSAASMTCVAPVYPAFCANPTVYELFDGIVDDIDAVQLLTSTVEFSCAPSTAIQSSATTNATLVNQTTGQPLGGSNATYVATGGPLANIVVKYLETTAAVTPIYFAEPTTGTYAWMQRGNPTPVATLLASACSAHADQFLVERVTDTPDKIMALVGYGICTGEGTFGAAHFFANVIVPNPTMYSDAWYVVSWADTNNDGLANDGDTFTVLASGN
ncbi:MAG TPA: hypothetical protein VH143_12090 [Kofleriaceae bacterium]|nr:hypothetical protein [Kofleriaceae bacterium]